MVINVPFFILIRTPSFIFFEMDCEPACAAALFSVSRASLLIVAVSKWSSSKQILTPRSLSILAVSRLSIVFLAKRDTDLVMMRSTFPR